MLADLHCRPSAGLRRVALLLLAALPLAAPALEPGATIPAGSLLAPLTRVEFAIYYPGEAPADPLPRLEALRAATAGAPRRVDKMPDRPTESLLVARLDRSAQVDYAPPDLALIRRFGYGLSEADADAILRSHTALILDFAHPTARALPVLHKASILVEQLARDTHGFIWDEATREVMSPDAWHERRVLRWTGDVPDVGFHVIVHAYDQGGSVRAVSLGMGKFGLPDVVLPRFSGTLIKPMGFLFDLTVQAMVEGASPQRAGELDIDLHAVHNEQARALMATQLKPGAPPARLAITVGHAESGDASNRLLEFSAARYPGSDAALRLSALSHSLYDAEDDLKLVRTTDELQDASDAARAKLPALHAAFLRGQGPVQGGRRRGMDVGRSRGLERRRHRRPAP